MSDTKTWTTDNRWSPGSSGATVPADAPAAYAARWIDQGDYTPADVVPDRQGFAYNDGAVHRLIAFLATAGESLLTPMGMPRDQTYQVVDESEGWVMIQRRAGGYIYVDAWLLP
jgi:hypothetical protein